MGDPSNAASRGNNLNETIPLANPHVGLSRLNMCRRQEIIFGHHYLSCTIDWLHDGTKAVVCCYTKPPYFPALGIPAISCRLLTPSHDQTSYSVHLLLHRALDLIPVRPPLRKLVHFLRSENAMVTISVCDNGGYLLGFLRVDEIDL